MGARVESAGCGVLRLTNASDYCTYSHPVSQVEIGGKCAVGRVRAAASAPSPTVFVELLGLDGPDAILVPDVQLGPDPIDIEIGCRLPDQFTVEAAYFLAKIGAPGGTTFHVDLVEVEVVDCEDTDISQGCGEDG